MTHLPIFKFIFQKYLIEMIFRVVCKLLFFSRYINKGKTKMNNFYPKQHLDKKVQKYMISSNIALLLGLIIHIINKMFLNI